MPPDQPIASTGSASSAKINLLGMPRAQLEAFFVDLGEKPYRATQVMKWIYGAGVTDIEAMTNISKALRTELARIAEVHAPAIDPGRRSSDGVVKWLTRVQGGQAVETVLIPDWRPARAEAAPGGGKAPVGLGQGTAQRNTLCISSQVGCALDCSFCATGKQGFNGNLSRAEIVGQVWRASRELAARGDERGITNVVFMGMGEPLLNFEPVVDAADVFMDDLAFGISKRRVTISTAGVVPRIRDLASRTDVSLAVSLHAARDELRDVLVPLNRRYPIAELLDACRHYLRGLGERRNITFEYTLIEGVNDGVADAKDLVRLLAGMRAKVNLIPFNPFADDANGYRRPSPDAHRQISDEPPRRRDRRHAAHHPGRRNRRRLRPTDGDGSRPHEAPGAAGFGAGCADPSTLLDQLRRGVRGRWSGGGDRAEPGSAMSKRANPEPDSPEAESGGFGDALREARERAQLSITEVANALKVGDDIVSALEHERYEALPAPPYVRGYMQRYARLVGLDDAALVESLRSVSGIGTAAQPIKPRPRPSLTEFTWRRWGILYGTAIALFVLIVAVALWWAWPGNGLRDVDQAEHRAGDAESDRELAAPSSPARTEATVPVRAESPAQPEAMAPVRAVPAEVPTEAAAGLDETSEGETAPTEAEATAQPESAVLDAVEEAALAESEASDEAAEGRDTLAFSFREDCWVEVRDQSGDLVHGDLGRGGQQLTLSGEAPFSILIGNPAAVALSFNGEPVTIDPVRPGQVARFELGD